MIKLVKKGKYKLVGTPDHKIILFLDEQGYHWGHAKRIGLLLTFSKHAHRLSYLLTQGEYKMYDVKNETQLVDLYHLELSLGRGRRQGYLLLTGLPTSKKIRSRIVPTAELIPKERR